MVSHLLMVPPCFWHWLPSLPSYFFLYFTWEKDWTLEPICTFPYWRCMGTMVWVQSFSQVKYREKYEGRDGSQCQKQGGTINKWDTTSPTTDIETVLLTTKIYSEEGWVVATIDITKVFFKKIVEDKGFKVIF